MATILVTGSSGQLGSALLQILSRNYQIVPADLPDLDITDFESTRQFVQDHAPDTIIHAAAFTHVDDCENNPDLAFQVNSLGTRNISIAAIDVGAKLFYISTDYVFDGSKDTPYREYDKPNPINIYGTSKLLGERFVIEQMNKFFIIRIAWLYGFKGKNFVTTILRLAKEKKELEVVDDQRGCPTFTLDVARQVERLIPTDSYGIYHCTSQGSCTWYDFACEIVNLAGLEVRVERIDSEKLSLAAKRPAYAVLENYMLYLQGLDMMPPWEQSLQRFLGMLNMNTTS